MGIKHFIATATSRQFFVALALGGAGAFGFGLLLRSFIAAG
mgnify:CR=1 FL=1|jgi:hypothetical protein